MNEIPKVAASVGLTLAVLLTPRQPLAAGSARAEAAEVKGLAPIACTIERPTAWRGETVSLHAWVPPPDSGRPTSPNYEWTASGGHIVGAGATASWTLDTESGAQTATVRISGQRGSSSKCSLRIIVKVPDRGPLGTEAGRSLLIRGRAEERGYGLYSYLLLGSPQDVGTRERYLQVVQAYWNMVPAIRDLEAFLPRDALNVTYLPVDTAPGENPSDEWALDHYDYARARAILRTIDGDHRRGPYLVSSQHPVILNNALLAYLYVDLSTIPPSLAGDWMRAFLNEAAQWPMSEPRPWDLWGIEIRTVFVVASTGLDPVMQNIDKLVTWFPNRVRSAGVDRPE